MSDILLCSAKGCRATAEWALRWNNPKLHPPERRKTWLACVQHRDSLSAFLSARGFLREVTPVEADVEAGSGSGPAGVELVAPRPGAGPAESADCPGDSPATPAGTPGDRPPDRR